jgi:sulfite exporter TauE/SafE/copper chaperone CopZ
MAEERIVRKGFIAEGTTCASCAEIIKRQAMKVEGVRHVTFDYSTETGQVTFDEEKTNIDQILSSIEEKGYKCFILKEDEKSPGKKPEKDEVPGGFHLKPLGWVFAIVGLIAIGYYFSNLFGGIGLPDITQNMSYGLLFVVGLLTGFHCVAMCGGFVLSYTAKAAEEKTSPHRAHLMYAIGKTLSYTVIGAAFGLLGSIIAFTPFMRGVAGVVAGIFLLLFGLRMLNIFPALRKIQFHEPKFITRFAGEKSQKTSSPLIVGLLNGLMIACGPLQAVYVLAAGTGSMIEGAKLLFVFALGTLPVMLGFGYMTSFISSKVTHKILKASGVIVILLGLIMVNRGLALTGTGYDLPSIASSLRSSGTDNPSGAVGTASSNLALLNQGYQEIRMDVTASGWKPDRFVLQKGVPVRWIINGKQITNCNKAIQVPKLGLSFDIKPGEQTIEFTPTEAGTMPWSCWMGMIRGTFIVVDDATAQDADNIKKEIDNAPAATAPAGTCGMGGGGGCGCGMM